VCVVKQALKAFEIEVTHSRVQTNNGPYCFGDSSVGIATGYGLDGRGSIPCRAKRFFSSPQLPDSLWGPLSLISSAPGGSFTRGKPAGA
jgi:hypothetical protein